MSVKTDYQVKIDKFKTSVSLQYQTLRDTVAANGYRPGYNVSAANYDEVLNYDFDAIRRNAVQTGGKSSGAKTPVKKMIFELEILKNVPPLELLINPESFEITFTPKISEARVRLTNPDDSGYIFQFHHDELDSITASGVSAMFYNNNGLTIEDREKSAAYKNIDTLLAMYRNNGKNYNSKPEKFGQSYIQSVGNVLLHYDGILYYGAFESLSLSETDDKPYNISFQFTFKVTSQYGETPLNNDIKKNV